MSTSGSLLPVVLRGARPGELPVVRWPRPVCARHRCGCGRISRDARCPRSRQRQGVPPPRRTSRTMPEAWVYLLRCRDGSLYTGWTVDLERRIAWHRSGVASHYTASRLPVELALAIPMSDHTAARPEEARIKRLPRSAKLALLTCAQTPA